MISYKFFVAMTATVILNGCSSIYDGAIYSSYEEINIGIRSAPETATPFKLNFGREQAVVSFVPHKDDEKLGDAVSILASNDTRSIRVLDFINNLPAPADEGTSPTPAVTPLPPITLVRSQSRLVTGNAAVVLTVPEGSTVVIERPGQKKLEVEAEGQVSDRIASAFKPSTQFGSPDFKKLDDLTGHIDRCSDENKIYLNAAKGVDQCFTKLFKKFVKISDDTKRFEVTRQNYLILESSTDCPGNYDEKYKKVVDSLQHSFNTICN